MVQSPVPPRYVHEDAKDAPALFLGCGYCNRAYMEKRELEVHIRLLHDNAPYCTTPAPLPQEQSELLHQPRTTLFSEGIPLAEVNRHNVPGDCWVAISGKVYDLSEFLDRHPAGKNTILAWAGKDATTFFKSIHQEMWLKQYLRPEAYLGELGIQDETMSAAYWDKLRQARVDEIREELHYLTDGDVDGSMAVAAAMAAAGPAGKKKERVAALEAMKAAALREEDFSRADQINATIKKLSAPAQDTAAGIPLSEVAQHNKAHDCWVAVNGTVYDLTEFLLHATEGKNRVLAAAGRDASEQWNKIPGFFPSDAWFAEHVRPEFELGPVAPEPERSQRERLVAQLREELRHLEGPTESMRAAAAAGRGEAPKAVATEEARFPRLRELKAARPALPLMTRAEIALHKDAGKDAKPYVIIHNKVYDLQSLLGNHPGGDELLLTRVGTDCTQDFELFEHSEKARVKREQEMLIGELVPQDRWDYAAQAGGGAAAQAAGGAAPGSELALYARIKLYDLALAACIWYAHSAWQKRKPLPRLIYSRLLRHLHLLMALGIFGAVGTAQVVARTEGVTRKRYLRLHKQLGVGLLLGLALRVFARARSGLPPRFPAPPLMQAFETQSLRAFYALGLALPLTGVAYEYYLYYAAALRAEPSQQAEERDEARAQQAMAAHRVLGKALEYAWLPFHLTYTVAYHWANGRGVVRKVNPFI